MKQLEVKKSFQNHTVSPSRSFKSLTSRRSSNAKYPQKPSFEYSDLVSERKGGLQLKDPTKVEELMKRRQQYFPKQEMNERINQRNPDLYRPYDLLKRSIPDTQHNLMSMINNTGDPRKNFFEFNTYFYKNYQANNNGPCTTLPQILIKKVENFQDKLEQMIKDM